MMLKQNSAILFLSTFPPEKSGIASFTHDLIDAIKTAITDDMVMDVCALDKKKNKALYDDPVTMVMDSHEVEACIETALIINKDPAIKLVCIEHGFSLYGGEMGEFLLGFLSMLEKPFIIRFHNLPPAPALKMLRVVQAIGMLADNVIVMTKNMARLLKEDYQLSPDKIIIIPYGTHAGSRLDASELKLTYNLENKQVLTTFGLLSSDKGIEKGIIAMKEISASYPDAIYVVLGQTHPNVLEQEGEKYRNFLQKLIEQNGLQENVLLINEYVSTDKLMDYLALTDIYLFTSKDPDQAVSGTFLNAMSAGCAIISNPFVLAKEMLDDDTGIVLTSGRENELAESAIRILKDPQLKRQMSNNAFMRTRNTTWEKVGQRHAALFYSILGTSIVQPRLSSHYIN